MHRSLPALLILGTVVVFAAQPHGRGLDVETKQRLTQIADEALRDQNIDLTQRNQTVRWINAEPCDLIQRKLSNSNREAVELALSVQRKQEKAEVLEYFEYQGWVILFTNAGPGDEPYLFYPTDPANGIKPIAIWAGAATIFETSKLRKWAVKNAPGIPHRLASCFAWHVTIEQ